MLGPIIACYILCYVILDNEGDLESVDGLLTLLQDPLVLVEMLLQTPRSTLILPSTKQNQIISSSEQDHQYHSTLSHNNHALL